MRFPRLTLRWKLPVLLSASALLAVVAFGFFAYRHASNSAIDRM